MSELKLFSIDDLVKVLHVTRRTIYSYIESGNLEATKIGRSWKIQESEVERFLREGTKKKICKTTAAA